GCRCRGSRECRRWCAPGRPWWLLRPSEAGRCDSVRWAIVLKIQFRHPRASEEQRNRAGSALGGHLLPSTRFGHVLPGFLWHVRYPTSLDTVEPRLSEALQIGSINPGVW